MLSHLNKFMKKNRDFSSELDKLFYDRFPIVAKLVNENLEKPFRPRGIINSAVLEAVMVTLLEDERIDGPRLKAGYKQLLDENEFLEKITGGTTDTLMLQGRIAIAKKIL